MFTFLPHGATAVRALIPAVLALLLLATWFASAAGAATVATGERQSCGIFSGQVRCWGQDTSGALGFLTDSHEVPYATPVGAPITGATDVDATSTGNGGSGHVCAVAGGAAWCWGPNGYGVAGTGTKERYIPVPVAVPALASGVTLIEKNASRSCAHRQRRRLVLGQRPQRRRHDQDDSPVPVAVAGMAAGVTDIGAGWRSVCVLQAGSVYCCGNGIHGQLAAARAARRPRRRGAAGPRDGGRRRDRLRVRGRERRRVVLGQQRRRAARRRRPRGGQGPRPRSTSPASRPARASSTSPATARTTAC